MQTEKPDTTEQYTSAIGASNLRVQVDSNIRSQADVIMAAAWSKSRLGSALLRLHSEWDRSQHPRQMTKQAIQALALTLEPPKGCPPDRRAAMQLTEAHQTAAQWYRHEVGLLLGRLKTLPDVRAQVTLKAEEIGCGRPADVASKVILWWLTRLCPVCNGTKFEVAAGTGRQTGRVCGTCKGTGETQIPCFQPGRELATYIDDCVSRARQDIRTKLNGIRVKADGRQS